jgi:hypothetical protein
MMAQVRLELAEEDVGKARNDSSQAPSMSLHSFLYLGMELESRQYVYLLHHITILISYCVAGAF